MTSAVLATGVLWLLIGGLLRANQALREARAELAELAVAEERLRFARDLHDLLGHDIKALTRSGLTQVREAVDGYRRPTLSGELAGARIALEAAGIGAGGHRT